MRTIELKDGDVAFIIRSDNSIDITVTPDDISNPTSRIMYIVMCAYSWAKDQSFVKTMIAKFAEKIKENGSITMT